MSVRGLAPREVVIPFGVGLNQKVDSRALPVGSLARCLDAAFTEYGGLQTRYPYASIGANIFGGGTVSDCRRIVENGNELLLFTKTGLYSWNPSKSAWFLKGTHLAVKTTEETRFATTDDQTDCDRAEIDGTIFYAWSGGTVGYVAAQDKESGNVVLSPTALPGAGLRMRLTALETVIILTFHDDVAGTYCYALNPDDPTAALAGSSTTVAPSGMGYYDIVKQPGADVAVFASLLAGGASYRVGTISNAGVVASSTKARAAADAIAVACTPNGTQVQIVRGDGGPKGDLVTIAGFVDTAHLNLDIQAGIGVGVAYDYASIVYLSALVGSAYRAHVFWGGDAETAHSTIDTDGTLGTPASIKITVQPASHAFEYEGRAYLWTAFAQTSTVFSGGFAPQFSYSLQNTYFLLRDDGFLVAKASGGVAGGFGSLGWLPGVTFADGEYAWSGINRQLIDLGGAGQTRTSYGARVPREISIAFDSNEARRTARLGQTLYITGGEILQYDGSGIYEVGFHIYPNTMTLAELAAGNLAAGTYAVKQTWRWDNARGETDRSTTATTGTVAIASAPGGIEVSAWLNLQLTHKTNRPIAVETWRTVANPPPESPFYLVTDKDPEELTNPNRYLPNGTTVNGDTLNDELVDADLVVRETSQENGGLLEPLSPPPATIIHATAERIFLAGVAGDPHRVWYSRQRQDGEVASFHDALTVSVPRQGGAITAIAVRDGVLYVWRETACYAFPGDGFDNLGGGQNFGPSRLISTDVGCVAMEALAQTSQGFVFKSLKGWYALAGAQVEYIGDKVSDYDSETVCAVHVLESQHEIRVLTTARMLVLNTNVNQWGEWTVNDGLHACLWNGTYHYLATAAIKAEQTTYTGVTYGMDVETAWIPLGNVQGYGRVWKILVLGETRSAGALQMRLYRNWIDSTAFQTKSWELTPTTVGGPMQVKHGPSIQEMQAIKIRITAGSWFTPEGGGDAYFATADNDVFKLTTLALELGVSPHLAHLPLAQTQ